MVAVQLRMRRYGLPAVMALCAALLSGAAQAYTPEQQQACSGDAFRILRRRDTGHRPRHRMHDRKKGPAQPRLPGIFQGVGAGGGSGEGGAKAGSHHAGERAQAF